MIEIIIFYIHILSWLWAFTFTWQHKGLKNAFLSLAVLGFIFIIFWTITSPLARLIYPDSFHSVYFTKDTLSLVLVLIPESIFYYFYFVKESIKLSK